MPKPSWGPGRDWRGTEIMPGDTVIYATGESCKPVQAEVLSLVYPGGLRAKLKPIYRAGIHEWTTPAKTVQVDTDKLTVVIDLPACLLPENVDELRARLKIERTNMDSHDLKYLSGSHSCVNCAMGIPEVKQQFCPSASTV